MTDWVFGVILKGCDYVREVDLFFFDVRYARHVIWCRVEIWARTSNECVLELRDFLKRKKPATSSDLRSDRSYSPRHWCLQRMIHYCNTEPQSNPPERQKIQNQEKDTWTPALCWSQIWHDRHTQWFIVKTGELSIWWWIVEERESWERSYTAIRPVGFLGT